VTASTSGAVPFPEDRACSKHTATLGRPTNDAGALYRKLAAHGRDDGLHGISAWMSLQDLVIQAAPQRSDVMQN